MARTSAVDVRGILGRNYDGSTGLEPFVETATVMVDELVTCASAKGITLSDALLERIEAYLAAHYYGHADQFYAAKSTERASATFQGQTGMGLDSSQYGQAAKRMDRSGCLASMDSGNRAGGFWLGKPPSEQLNHWERD